MTGASSYGFSSRVALTPTLSQREREQEGSRAKQRPDETKAERSDGPCGLPFPSGRAEKRRAWGGHGLRSKPMLRALTRCGCLSGARKREASSAAPPRARASQVARSEAKGHGQWGRLFLWLLSFWRDKKKVTAPPGAHPGQQRIQPHTVKPQTHSAPPDTAARSSGCRACPAAPSPPSTARARTDRPPHKSPCARTACPWC